MPRLRLSFTARRRRKLALKVDQIERCEIRNTITEPISLTALSLGIPSGLIGLGIPDGAGGPSRGGWPGLDPAAGRGGPGPGSAMAMAGAGAAAQAQARAILAVGDLRPMAIARPAAAGGSAAEEKTTPTAPPAKVAPGGDWLDVIPLLPGDPGSSSAGGLSAPWHPARSAAGGLALPPRGGSGSGAQPETIAAVQGRITPLRVPPPPEATGGGAAAAALLAAVAGAGAGRSGGTLPEGRLAPGSDSPLNPASVTQPTAPDPDPSTQAPTTYYAGGGGGGGGGVESDDTDPATDAGAITPVAVDLTSAPYLVSGNSSGAAMLAFSHFPLYTLDYNNGVVLFPNAYQYANPGGNVDLRAQVRDTAGPYTYTWDTSNITGVATSISASGYKLTFQWNSTITGGPYTRTVGLTVTNGSSQQESQTYTFYVPNGTGSAGTGTMTWPTSLPPDTVLASAPAWDSQYVSVAANTGALNTQVALPSYNPNVPPVVLAYDSLAADPRPIVVIHHEINPVLAVPTKTSAQLKFNATTGTKYYYDTSKFTAGDIAAIALQANVPTLATDRYAYTATVVDDRSGTLTTTVYSGNALLVNESTNALGAGWTLQGLMRIKTNPTGGGGVILNRGSGDAEWFSGSPGTGGNYASPPGDFSTLTKTASGYTRTLTDGTQQVFDSSGNETASVDRNGLRTTFTYSSGLLSTIKDPYSNLTTFTYSSGKLQTIKDPASRLATFTFSGATLTAVQQHDGTQDVRTTFTYDGSGRMTQFKDPLARVVTIAYDSANRVGTITRPDSSVETFAAYQERGFDTTGTAGSPANPTLLAEARATYTDPLANGTDLRSDWRGLGLAGQMTDPSGNVATHDSDANGLASIAIDRLNRITLNAYDGSGNPTTITYPDGNIEKYTYNGFSEPLTHTDPLNHTTSYTYDGTGNNTGIQDPLSNRTTMTYTANGRLQTVQDANSNVTSFQYDTQDRLTTITYPDGTTRKFVYDTKGNAVTITDERGNSTTFSFDALNRMTGTKDALGNRVTNVYDSVGNLTQVQAPLSRTTNYAYDSMNRLTTLTDALSHATVNGYDASGNLQTVKDPLNRVTSYAYDSQNRRTVVTDAAGQSTTTVFDAEGQATQVTDRLGRITTTTYNSRGWKATSTDPLNRTTSYTYSATGKVAKQSDPSFAPSPGQRFDYDALDRLVTYTDGLGNSAVTVYDAVGNVQAKVDANGNRTTFAYDSRNRLTTITDALAHTTVNGYDAAGNRQTVKDALGHTTTTLYDALNRATTIVDALTGTTTIALDAAGRRTGLTDPVTNRTTWSYDAADRLTTMVDALGTTTYVYDNANQLTDQTDRAGRRVTHAYDSVGRRTGDQWFGTGARLLTYTYDFEGQLIGARDPDATLTFTYDPVGNLGTVVTSGPGAGQPTVTLTYGYNAGHDRTSVTDSLSSVGRITTTCDMAHRVVSLQQSFGGSAGPSVEEQYDAANRLTSMTRAIGGTGTAVQTSLVYDAANRLTTQVHRKFVPGIGGGGTTTPLATYLYGYDAANRLTTQVDAEGTATFTSDVTDQLTTVAGARSESYGYDANGNRNTTGYTVISGNRYSSGGGFTYTYDAEGNETGKRESATGNVWTFAYDHRNRLTVVTEKNSGGTTIMQATYTYDALDRRIGTKVDDDGSGAHAAVQTWTVYDGSSAQANPYADFDSSATLKTRYLYGPAVDALLARTSSGGTTAWYLPDKLGTIRDIADTSGSVIDHVIYNSYGGVTSESNASNGDRFKFTGREYDATTGLYYYRARYYDAAIGRFMSHDPIGFEAEDTNPFRYVGNGPTNGSDPTGLFEWPAWLLGRPGDWLDRNFGGGTYGAPGWSGTAAGVGAEIGSFAPIAGDIADIGQVVTGRDLQGNPLTPTERGVTAIAAALPLIPASMARRVINPLARVPGP